MRNIKGPKSSKSEANYISKSKNNEKCINCTMWRDPNKCSAVAGIISPNGWCDWFEAGSYGKHGKKIDENRLLTTVICPNILLTESANNKIILEEIELYENFLDSIKTYLRTKVDDTIDDVGTNIRNFKDAGIIIKDIITDPDYLEKVSIQLGKRLRTQIKNIKTGITKIASSTNNSTVDDFANKINNILNLFNTGLQQAIRLGGWKGLLYKLGLYGFVRFIYNKINEYTKMAELIKFISSNVITEFLSKFDDFKDLINNFAGLTMQKFMDFFSKLNEVKEIFIDTLSEIRRKLLVGSNLSSNVTPIQEHGGRIVKGVNTTQDVGVDEIKKQAAKFGNKVNKDGYPPVIDKKAAKNTTPNNLYNLGLAEEYDSLEIAIMEGGHSLDEDWKSKLRNVAAAGSLGLTGLAGVHTADAYSAYKDQMAKTPQVQTTSKQQTQEPVTKAVYKAPTSSAKDDEKVVRPKARPASPLKSLRPVERPTVAISGRKAEQYLIDMATKHGITGVELASFLAQTAQETNQYKFLRELGKNDYFKKYEKRFSPKKAKELGNTQKGDGARFKGRGYIHLTGRYNYNEAGKALGIDLTANPELLETPKVGALTAIWFWKTKVRPNVSDYTDVDKVTDVVNLYDVHRENREKYFEKYVDRMTQSGKINENDIVDFSKRKQEKDINDFHKKMKTDMQGIVAKKMEAYDIANEQGIFNDLPIGARFTLPKGSSYKVLSHSMIRNKTDQLPRHQLEFRNKHNFGPPKFIELDGFYYQPRILAREVAGEMEGSESLFELDKLINFETGEKRYTKFTGPKKVTEKKKPNQVKGKEKMPKMSKPSKTGEQAHPYRNRLVGETIDMTPVLIAMYNESIKNNFITESKIDNSRLMNFLNDYKEDETIGNSYIYCSIILNDYMNFIYIGHTNMLYKLISKDKEYYKFNFRKEIITYPQYKDMGDSKLVSLLFESKKDFNDFTANLKLQFSNEYKISSKVIDENRLKENWYHGTPDVRNIKKAGGFEDRTISVSYISNPDKWQEIQNTIAEVRDSNRDEYFRLLDIAGDLRKHITIPSPIFLTNNYGVAKTYADPKRAWDYQGAEEKVLEVNVTDGKTLTINANGSDFRGISIDYAMSGLVNSGISADKAKQAIKMFGPNVRNNKISTDSLAVIGHMFDFDIIDVKNVLDSYNVGKTKSTVRMVFDPKRISIVEKLNEDIGYKVMAYDKKSNTIYSLADDSIRLPLNKEKQMSMSGKGIYLSNSEEFVKTYYSGLSDYDEVLLKIKYDPNDIIMGNNKNSESEFTVSNGKIVDFEILSENMSYTGSLKRKQERAKGIEPGTDRWFAHWFSLPFMIDQRKRKNRKR